MKNISKNLIFLVVIAAGISVSNAQDINNGNYKINSNELLIPKLSVLIDSVLKRSAMVNFRNQRIGVKESVLASERKYWSRNLGIQAETRYGNLSSFATSEDTFSNTASLTTAKQFNYSVGFYLKFPLFDVLNRKNQIKIAKLEVDEAKSMAEFQKEEIRETVIRLYQDLILKHKLLQIRSRRLGDGKVNMQMIEKEFRNGLVPLSEYVRINGMTTNMEADYETAMSEFITAKQILEDLAGFVFGLTHSN